MRLAQQTPGLFAIGAMLMSALIILVAVVFVVLIIILCLWYQKKRENFVVENSTALRKLREINAKYVFYRVPNFNMVHSYDNKHFFQDISTEDFLIYELEFKKNKVREAMADAAENKKKWKIYQDEVKEQCQFAAFDFPDPSTISSKIDRWLIRYWKTKRFHKLCDIEERRFHSAQHYPITELKINVTLHSTDMRGRIWGNKTRQFREDEITKLIERLERKHDGRFLDTQIWNALCRVERGKVTNKVRFAVYRRDGNRCRKCGSPYNLEVDHIYPISKGGKSTFNNLQTLCHWCNVSKSNFVEPSAVNKNRTSNNSVKKCPNCGVALVKRQGSYGVFYGCPNYPKCRYTSK